jgi:type I restriction enzyme, S subunit
MTGLDIGSKKVFYIEPGDFVLNIVFAWEGAVAVTSDAEASMIASHRFPTFRPDPARLEAKYLLYWCQTELGRSLLDRVSPGGAGRNRTLNRAAFLNQDIPLPPLEEQRRVVRRIEELTAQIREARALRQQTVGEAGALLITRAGKVFARIATQWPVLEFGSFFPHVTSGPRNWGSHYDQNGARFYRAQDIGPNGQMLTNSKVFVAPPAGEQGRSAMLQRGDLMLVITGATVGRVTVFRDGLEPGLVSQHVAICRLPPDQVDLEFALWGLRSPQGQAQLLGQRYGQGKPGLNLSNIRSLRLPFPPLPEQRHIVTELDGLQATVDELKRLQVETTAGLDALLPAVLHQAFKGEL